MIKKYGIKYSVRRYSNLEKSYTRIPNDIFKVVTSTYQLTVYTYLCFRYNRDYQYAFPSLKTIANDTNISLTTVKKIIKDAKGQVFNIGGGIENSLSLLELFSLLEKELNVKLNYTQLPPRESDQKVFVADIKKII